MKLVMLALVAQEGLSGKARRSDFRSDTNIHFPSAGLNCRAQGLKKCNGVCVDIQTDPNHCGACKTVCSNGATCINGSCFTKGPRKCKKVGTCGNFISCGSSPGSSCACVSDYSTGKLSCVDLSSPCVACQFASNCTAGPGAVRIRISQALPDDSGLS